MKHYLRFLAVCYLVGAVLHLLDMFSLRLQFNLLQPVWKMWIVALFAADLIAAIGLWQQKKWAVYLFLCIALAQLVAYSGVLDSPRNEIFLIGFHGITVCVYFLMRLSMRE